MGNAHSNENKRRRRSLFRSHSQEGVDPRVVNAALERAARTHPEIYRKRSSDEYRVSKPADHPQGPDGVAYFEEYEGNEPLDESWQQQPLEPEEPPHLLPMSDHSSSAGRHRHSSIRSLEATGVTRQQTRRTSHEDFANSVSHMNPQEVLRNLEGLATVGVEDADEYLHSLKNLKAK